MLVVSVTSPGHDGDELKDQDRVAVDHTSCVMVVCDGVSTSPEAARAAERAVQDPARLINEGFDELCRDLRQMRELLIRREIRLSPTQEATRSIFEEIVREMRRRAYQTTIMAVRWRREPTGGVKLTFRHCGDTALIVFLPVGAVQFTTLNLKGVRIERGTNFTEVLPDNEDVSSMLVNQYIASSCQILVCSDGFYGGFETSTDIYEWLMENAPTLKSGDKEAVRALMAERHRTLGAKTGDDDISFVWCTPETNDRVIQNYDFGSARGESAATNPSDGRRASLPEDPRGSVAK